MRGQGPQGAKAGSTPNEQRPCGALSLFLRSARSEEVLHPDVPHSLRLQGILVGGVVVVFSKQQNYLWGERACSPHTHPATQAQRLGRYAHAAVSNLA